MRRVQYHPTTRPIIPPITPTAISVAAAAGTADRDALTDQAVHARRAIKPSLAFKDPRLEHLYQVDYFDQFTNTIRLAMFIAVVLWILFVINDILKEQDGLRANFPATMGLRFGAVALALLAKAATFMVKAEKRHVAIPWIVGTLIVIFGTAQVFAGVIESDTIDPTYSVSIVLLSSTSSAFFRLPCFASIACNLTLFFLYVLITCLAGSYGDTNELGTTIFWLGLGVLIFSIHSYDREWNLRSSYLAQKRLEYEERKSQRVLLKMLPATVIQQLRAGREFVHERHSNVSVLFSHIDHFDAHTSALSPSAVIGLLNQLFSRFDQLTDLFGVYKVETIGDVYLVAAGLPEPREDHASALTHLAVSMQEMMSDQDFQEMEEGMSVQLKIGIHSGPVIAGVIGLKYPRYRLMSDTVNTASRMSSTCPAGAIQLSSNTYHQLQPDQFLVECRGEIAVKGKGMMTTYLVKGRMEIGQTAADQMCATNNYNHAQKQETQPGVHLPTSSPDHSPTLASLMTGESGQKSTTAANPSAITGTKGMEETFHNVVVHIPTSSGSLQSHATYPEPIHIYMPYQFDTPDTRHHSVMSASATSTVEWMSEDGRVKSAVGSIVAPNNGFSTSLPTRTLSDRHVVVKRESESRVDSKNSHRPSLVGGKRSPDSASVGQLDPVEDGTLNILPPMIEPATAVETIKVDEVPATAAIPEAMAPMASNNATSSRADNELQQQPPDNPPPSNSNSEEDRQHKDGHSDVSRRPISPFGHGSISPTSLRIRGGLCISAQQVKSKSSLWDDTLQWEHLTLNPHNPLRLAFARKPGLERQFQLDYVRKYLAANRRATLAFIVAIMLLGIYDTLYHLPETEDDTRRMTVTWCLRLVALIAGFAFYSLTHSYASLYERYQQVIMATVWCLLGGILVTISILLNTFDQVYGVTCILLLLTMTSTFVGLQFVCVTPVTIIFLVWYFVGAMVVQHAFPLVVFFLLAGNVLTIVGSRASEFYLRADWLRHLRLQQEERRTRHFLDSMLPKTVLREIKLDRSFIAHEFIKASVLFSDIVGFTSMAARLRAEDVVAILNVMFSCFDALTTKHHVYKVETIGDAYLACNGVVHRSPTQTTSLIRFALDAQEACRYMYAPDGQQIVIRIGIHTGSVVAGVVGKKMPRYHLFGETVTVAEEMEQNGLPGEVVISKATYDESGGNFEVEELEPIILHAKPAKNILPQPNDATHATQPTDIPSHSIMHSGAVAPLNSSLSESDASSSPSLTLALKEAAEPPQVRRYRVIAYRHTHTYRTETPQHRDVRIATTPADGAAHVAAADEHEYDATAGHGSSHSLRIQVPPPSQTTGNEQASTTAVADHSCSETQTINNQHQPLSTHHTPAVQPVETSKTLHAPIKPTPTTALPSTPIHGRYRGYEKEKDRSDDEDEDEDEDEMDPPPPPVVVSILKVINKDNEEKKWQDAWPITEKKKE